MAKGGFPGMMGGGNMQQLARQAQKLQQQMTEAQENLDAAEYEAASGGGMVKVVAQGDMTVQSITIDPAAIDPEDADMLQDMVCAAVNEALRAVSAQGSARIGQATGGMNIPGLM